MQIATVLFDGFDKLDAVGPFGVFGHTRAHGADIDPGLYTLDGQTAIVSGHGLAVQPDGLLPVPARGTAGRR